MRLYICFDFCPRVFKLSDISIPCSVLTFPETVVLSLIFDACDVNTFNP